MDDNRLGYYSKDVYMTLRDTSMKHSVCIHKCQCQGKTVSKQQ